jgi:signal transduction histidine kinase
MTPKPAGRRLIAVLFVGATVAILNVALWVQYWNTRAALETELARRLENVAQTLGAVLDPEDLLQAWVVQPEGVDPEEDLTTEKLLLRGLLLEILEATDLVNITLYDRDGLPFLEAHAGGGGPPLPDPLYRAEILAALRGSTTHTRLYRSGSEYLMSGFAPVRGLDRFAVGVEADAKYFAALSRLRHSLLLVGAGSVLLLVALGIFHNRAQARLARAEAALQRSETLAAMGRMTAGIAHEIRNPLSVIRATATRLKKQYDDASNPDERFLYIAEEVDRLSAVLDGYLGFARDDPPQMERLDLVPLLQRTLRLMQPELESAGVETETQLPPACPIRGDAQRLQQLLMNLVLNALQAMQQGGRLSLHLRCETPEATLVLADTGAGIPPHLHQRIFEPFFTTKEKGSGLGLTVVRRIVEEHGGTIRLAARPSGGTSVEVRLPCEQEWQEGSAVH